MNEDYQNRLERPVEIRKQSKGNVRDVEHTGFFTKNIGNNVDIA